MRYHKHEARNNKHQEALTALSEWASECDGLFEVYQRMLEDMLEQDWIDEEQHEWLLENVTLEPFRMTAEEDEQWAE